MKLRPLSIVTIVVGIVLLCLQFKLNKPFSTPWIGYSVAGACIPLALAFNYFRRATNAILFWSAFLLCTACVCGYCLRSLQLFDGVNENVNRLVCVIVLCVLAFVVLGFARTQREASNYLFGITIAPVVLFVLLIVLKFFEVFGEDLGYGSHIMNIVLWGALAGMAYSFRYEYVPVPTRDIFCADCGQFLGPSSGFKCPCPRCGCNRYSTTDEGAGRTIKNR